MKSTLRKHGLHTVCEESKCPNASECFHSGTATFLILGDRCTRRCAFCAVSKDIPVTPDPGEPERVAELARELKLQHVVITSVTRDDLPDGGSSVFAETILQVRRVLPESSIEVLIPDFGGSSKDLLTVMNAGPDVLNHNIETTRELYQQVRPQADYRRSLELLSRSSSYKKTFTAGKYMLVKSGLMVGFGETKAQLYACFKDLFDSGVECLTIGQYLRPRITNIPVTKYYSPEEFLELENEARSAGITHVISAPLVRSSYKAGEMAGLKRKSTNAS